VRIDALEAGQARLAAAREQDEAARAEQQLRRDALSQASAASAQAKQAAGQAAAERARLEGGLREHEQTLTQRLGHDVEARQKGALEERLRAGLERLAAARAAHEGASAEHERGSREREKAEQALAAAAEAGAAAARVLQDHAQTLEAAEREARELKAKIDAVARGDDPAAERARLEQESHALAQQLQQAQRRERDSAEALLQTRLRREQAQHAMAEAQRALGEAGAALEQALAEAGFKSADAARAAALDASARRQLQELLDAFRAESLALRARLSELQRETGDGRVAADELQAAEAALQDGRQRLEDGAAEVARLAERIDDLERRAQKAREKSEAMLRERRRLGVYQQLRDDLRSENFRAFVLEEAFHELVAGASERLFGLSSGRYTFEFQDDAFHVLDHDNARERRSAETLSGGETFLASLALALELSQQIQRAAGAVHLDSLFIDEGFGTLDPETLDTIAGTLEELPVGGRMVGIITHLPELTERIPNRVRVERRPEGSRFSVETA
jgi:exonuclease SbcC